MKELTLLVWFMQLGLSVSVPLAGYVLLALWLQGKFQLGSWIVWAAVIIGAVSAIDGLRTSLRTLEKLSRKDKKEEKIVVSFNDHE